MAGHYRVAVADASLGAPEVNLGIIPGAEGTQRLPRLVGVAAAVEMCVSGRPIKAPQALQMGLIDRVIDGELLSGAVAFAGEVAGLPVRKTRERNDKLGPRQRMPRFSRLAGLRRARSGATRRLRWPRLKRWKPPRRFPSTKAAKKSARSFAGF